MTVAFTAPCTNISTTNMSSADVVCYCRATSVAGSLIETIKARSPQAPPLISVIALDSSWLAGYEYSDSDFKVTFLKSNI